jgi:Uma2 family endonuclease
MQRADDSNETIDVPRRVRFPLELRPPPGFDPARLETWPHVDGQLEFVQGRLLYMPPCGDIQSDVVSDAVYLLRRWQDAHPGFKIGTNEAGIRLAGASRGADAAVFRREDVAEYTGGFRRVAPVLAVEVAGEDEQELHLREKAGWYLSVGVQLVWLVLPDTREVIVMTAGGESRHRTGALPPHPALPDLAPAVDDFFRQLAGR